MKTLAKVGCSLLAHQMLHDVFATAAQYSGSGCSVNGPTPNSTNTVLQFFVMGDTPYDQEVGMPFEGEEFECIRDHMIPKMKNEYKTVSFVGHVGDIKKGLSTGGDPTCTDEVFESRRKLFERMGKKMDYLLVVGDNEFNECEGYIHGDFTENDPVKKRWRQYFAEGRFRSLTGRAVKQGKRLSKDVRQSGTPENFYFEFEEPRIGVFGITEPASDSSYNKINAEWVQENIQSSPSLEAVVLMGHARMSKHVFEVLQENLPSGFPIIYVQGNDHPDHYCMQHFARSDSDNFIKLTVAPFMASPLLVSVVKEEGNYFFHVEDTGYGCE